MHASKTDLVEGRICPSGHEAVKLQKQSISESKMYLKDTHLDEQEEVGILALGSGTLALLDVVVGDVDTLSQAVSYCS